MKKRKRIIIVIFMIISLLMSCIPSEHVEELAIITARGVDVNEEDILDATFVVFQFNGKTDNVTNIVSGKGKTLKGAMINADTESVFSLTPGKIQIELYGMEMAKKGILPLLDTLQRDSLISNTMYLTISHSTAKEILTMSEESISMNVGQFLHGVIDNNATDHNFPKITLQDFLRIYYNIGKDNVLAVFELEDDNIPKVTQIGLFRGDKLVSTLSIQESTLLNLVNRTVKDKVLEITLPLKPFEKFLEKREDRDPEDELHLAFLIEKGKGDIKLTDDTDNLTFETEVNLKLQLNEQLEGVLIKDDRVIQTLEEEIKKKLAADFESLLAKTQEHQSDPFGYGVIYRINNDHKLTRKEWREKYPNIKVNFNVKPKILQHGTLE